MKSNNLFLTGEKGVGKTTLLVEILNSLAIEPAGFMCIREGSKEKPLAFYLVSALQYLQQKEELSPAKESCFARRSDLESPWQIKDEVFNIRGKLLLEKPGEAPLVVMDELGRFEKNAAEFQKCVFDKLSSSVPVLGVIKDEKLPFLDTVRARPDTGVYRLTVNNRRLLKNKIMNWLKKY